MMLHSVPWASECTPSIGIEGMVACTCVGRERGRELVRYMLPGSIQVVVRSIAERWEVEVSTLVSGYTQ